MMGIGWSGVLQRSLGCGSLVDLEWEARGEELAEQDSCMSTESKGPVSRLAIR